ncbi:glycosyltransferase family 2 protein [Curtobacterium sp. VKM Ac-2922]|uniref:glycosyltransferase family 2 protein n=1 Tax=Curtobacterium sp. VKM Ac-2922 TaxID=2929475 RepID=UPI001FB548DE|nr:glycosyltransferase family 2 protein [Curtobacterium sp. VKM Ac-2922]MCJ1714155.1 glycosyltransferase [Curtobacterium sp. VKM Ac-2922]
MQLSVVIPARNAAKTLQRALTSTLRSAPAHSEVLVMDDGSHDGTADVAASIDDKRIKVLRSSSGLGVASALNTLLDEARGEFVARMDADDITLPGRFRAQLKRLRSGADFTFGGVIHFGTGLTLPYPSPPLAISPLAFPIALLVENPVAHSTMSARTASVKSLGGYRVCLAEDYDLWLRAAASGLRLERTSRPVTALRRHREQVTATHDWSARAAAEGEWQEAYSALAKHVFPTLSGDRAEAMQAAGSPTRKLRTLGGALEDALAHLAARDRVALKALSRRSSRS